MEHWSPTDTDFFEKSQSSSDRFRFFLPCAEDKLTTNNKIHNDFIASEMQLNVGKETPARVHVRVWCELPPNETTEIYEILPNGYC